MDTDFLPNRGLLLYNNFLSSIGAPRTFPKFPERAVRYDSQGPRQHMCNARSVLMVRNVPRRDFAGQQKKRTGVLRKRGVQPAAHTITRRKHGKC